MSQENESSLGLEENHMQPELIEVEEHITVTIKEASPDQQIDTQASATTENSVEGSSTEKLLQSLSSTKEDPDLNIEALSRDELAIYGYNMQDTPAEHIAKASRPPDKNKEAEEFSVVTNRKNKSKKGNTMTKKDANRPSPYKKTRGEGSHSQS